MSSPSSALLDALRNELETVVSQLDRDGLAAASLVLQNLHLGNNHGREQVSGDTSPAASADDDDDNDGMAESSEHGRSFLRNDATVYEPSHMEMNDTGDDNNNNNGNSTDGPRQSTNRGHARLIWCRACGDGDQCVHNGCYAGSNVAAWRRLSLWPAVAARQPCFSLRAAIEAPTTRAAVCARCGGYHRGHACCTLGRHANTIASALRASMTPSWLPLWSHRAVPPTDNTVEAALSEGSLEDHVTRGAWAEEVYVNKEDGEVKEESEEDEEDGAAGRYDDDDKENNESDDNDNDDDDDNAYEDDDMVPIPLDDDPPDDLPPPDCNADGFIFVVDNGDDDDYHSVDDEDHTPGDGDSDL
ncbi:hypothetical protein SPI_03754 [Niveomyces insectorum RCEF 264]|uniref:Uncharacterized protein n=1 Tax=Niveomyces insectorum RCEF 264 TaxID=1081102 RepID=A0A167WBT8_9HYPO|nr:hypothetical protein SPI_03754 [Niveomyces insectorum RCEF 264]